MAISIEGFGLDSTFSEANVHFIETQTWWSRCGGRQITMGQCDDEAGTRTVGKTLTTAATFRQWLDDSGLTRVPTGRGVVNSHSGRIGGIR
jgi:hypothetical protein